MDQFSALLQFLQCDLSAEFAIHSSPQVLEKGCGSEDWLRNISRRKLRDAYVDDIFPNPDLIATEGGGGEIHPEMFKYLKLKHVSHAWSPTDLKYFHSRALTPQMCVSL